MKAYFYAALASLFLLIILAGGCGRGRSQTMANQQIGDVETLPIEGSVDSNQSGLTEEDYRVIAMSPEQRWEYLFAKFRRMVKERYGVEIDYEPYPHKGTSGFGDDGTNGSNHQVQVDVDFNSTPALNQVLEESLELNEEGDTWTWDISFLERLAGDYDWNSTVAVADISPIVEELWHSWDGDEWPDNYDPNLDRIGVNSSSEQITYVDLLTTANNLGFQIIGYNVYYMSQYDSDWEEDGLLVKELTAASDRASGAYRSTWEGSVEGWELTEAGATSIDDGDLITVKPVFNVPGQGEVVGGENTRSDELTLEVPETYPPVAVLTADPETSELVDKECPVYFNGLGSTDQDGDVVWWHFDFGDGQDRVEYDGYPEDDPDDTGECTHTYTSTGTFYAKLWVEDDGENVCLNPDTVTIVVTGPPVVSGFTATANPAETGDEVTFTVTASENDPGDYLTQIRYDYNGDSNWDATETPGDGVSMHTFTIGELGTIHSLTYDSAVEVMDNHSKTTTKHLSDFGPELTVTHAVPHIMLTTDPSPINTYSGVEVEFDASASWDKDGPNGKPTRYEFTFGDGNSYYEEDGDADDGTFDGITTHTYSGARLCTATVTVKDAVYDTNDCLLDELHIDSDSVTVRIYGDPVLTDTPDVVDDGSHHGTTWSSLGSEPIALDINPSTGLPGIVYYGIPQTPPSGAPFSMPLFSEMTTLGWPSDPDLVYASGQGAWWIGEQCDLEYDPVLYDTSTNMPCIAATARANVPGPGSSGPALLLYRPGTSGWEYDTLIDDENVSITCNVRLLCDQTGAYVHYVRTPLIGYQQLCEIADVYGENNERVVQSEGNGVGFSHDFKPYQDDYTTNEHSVIYVVDNTSDYINFEGRDSSGYWTDSPVIISVFGEPSTDTKRLCALDYFKDSGLGVVWVDNSGSDLNWNEYDGDWSNAVELADNNVGKWCDFDYDENLKVPCVAYEQQVDLGHGNYAPRIYARACINGTWCSPVTVDTLAPGAESHLDLDVWNGYIYVAYSKSGEIYCAILDLFNETRS